MNILAPVRAFFLNRVAVVITTVVVMAASAVRPCFASQSGNLAGLMDICHYLKGGFTVDSSPSL
jgi:hypothetical protein